MAGSVKWVVGLVVSVLVIMVVMYFIKKAATKYNIPGVSTVAEGI